MRVIASTGGRPQRSDCEGPQMLFDKFCTVRPCTARVLANETASSVRLITALPKQDATTGRGENTRWEEVTRHNVEVRKVCEGSNVCGAFCLNCVCACVLRMQIVCVVRGYIACALGVKRVCMRVSVCVCVCCVPCFWRHFLCQGFEQE